MNRSLLLATLVWPFAVMAGLMVVRRSDTPAPPPSARRPVVTMRFITRIAPAVADPQKPHMSATWRRYER